MRRFHTASTPADAFKDSQPIEKPSDCTEIWTTGHPRKVCGLFTVNGYNNLDGRFSGQIEVFAAEPAAGNGKPQMFRRVGLIETNDYATRITAFDTRNGDKGHDRITENMAGIRLSRDAIKTGDDQNIAYRMARTIAENTDKGTDDVRGWLQKFGEDLQAQENERRKKLPGGNTHGFDPSFGF